MSKRVKNIICVCLAVAAALAFLAGRASAEKGKAEEFLRDWYGRGFYITEEGTYYGNLMVSGMLEDGVPLYTDKLELGEISGLDGVTLEAKYGGEGKRVDVTWSTTQPERLIVMEYHYVQIRLNGKWYTLNNSVMLSPREYNRSFISGEPLERTASIPYYLPDGRYRVVGQYRIHGIENNVYRVAAEFMASGFDERVKIRD